MDESLSGSRQLGLDLGEAATAPRSYAPDPAEVRAELLQLLATARSAEDRSPWDARTFQYHKTVFPQMARWLPDDERDQLCFEFARHVERIELLMAA
ncbi:MAG: hypothetical protein WDN24_00805 [Sphingomonas sp.]